MVDLSKRSSENEAQYIWRLSFAKDSGEIDMNWDQLATILNNELGYDNTSSAYRKQYWAAKKFLDAGVFDQNNNSKYLKELEVKKLALEAERQKLFATKVEHNRQLRQISRQELFYQNVANQLTKLEPPLEDFSYGPDGNYSDKEYVLTLSDIHAGARFQTETNSYSLTEMTARFGVLLDLVSGYVKDNFVKHMKVVCLGDTIQGMLRVSDLQLNETSIVEATVYVSKCISKFLNDLSAYCDIDYYHVPSANHTQVRPLGTKASELKDEDIEYIIGHYIDDVLALNEKVNVHLNFGSEYIEVPIFDELAIAMHGHQIKDTYDALKTLSFKNHKFYSTAFMGHYHASGTKVVNEYGMKDSEVIVCPSFIGTDPYSDSLFKGSRPACGIYVFDERNGHIRSDKIVLT